MKFSKAKESEFSNARYCVNDHMRIERATRRVTGSLKRMSMMKGVQRRGPSYHLNSAETTQADRMDDLDICENYVVERVVDPVTGQHNSLSLYHTTITYLTVIH